MSNDQDPTPQHFGLNHVPSLRTDRRHRPKKRINFAVIGGLFTACVFVILASTVALGVLQQTSVALLPKQSNNGAPSLHRENSTPPAKVVRASPVLKTVKAKEQVDPPTPFDLAKDSSSRSTTKAKRKTAKRPAKASAPQNFEVATAKNLSASRDDAVVNPPTTNLAGEPRDDEKTFGEAVTELYRSDKLLLKKFYPDIRRLVAAHFAQHHDSDIRSGLGADYDAMQSWFAEHTDVRDDLYAAFLVGSDNVSAGLRLFNELRNRFPDDKLVAYSELAIATAVVWDEPRRGVYNYEPAARHIHANVPADTLDGIENFRYLVAAEPVMQGRIQYAPWEFLIYVVNHRTPEQERLWAAQHYLGRRTMIGRCYSDVPYDYGMRNQGATAAALSGKDYTLANLLQAGGICAYQADFASRVSKSLGVPAASVTGQGENTEGHAWVMWVELKQATPTGLVFSLESHGRYQEHNFYVGNLRDPQTGEAITDRDMELRLHSAGQDTVAKRQAALAMHVYPLICEREKLDNEQRLRLLSQIINYCPGCEQAWLEIAKISRDVSGQKRFARQFRTTTDSLFKTFARFPDFTWKVINDLVAFEPDVAERTRLFERLVAMYELAQRPDLACEARLKAVDLLQTQDKPALAVEGLAYTIKKFPGEGRYVPLLLDRLEQICKDFPGSEQKLVQFYVQILPLVPQRTPDDKPSPFALKIYKRAAEVFLQCNQPQLAAKANIEYDKLRSLK